MKIHSLVLAAVCLTVSGVPALADSQKYILATTFNGSAWHKLEQVDEDAARLLKVCLVRGIYEGAYAMDPENALEQYGPWVSFGQLCEALDRFYKEERNLKIPVTQALVLIARNASGPAPQPARLPRVAAGTLVSMESPQ
jgi:hypothetical protein